ncbi:hypothetical protein MUK42_23641 [Musa troglodytarum]|uniref:Dehydrin n=1 Tax=Musa troglodytarum TaxID=320322 RepID=A0A9E7KD47_9LILI|nr:hypothetical protein MUK42_23641 [Musa troglodytarum]
MEKLPGGHSSEEAGAQHEPEKKGTMEKIKEKLPGYHNQRTAAIHFGNN